MGIDCKKTYEEMQKLREVKKGFDDIIVEVEDQEEKKITQERYQVLKEKRIAIEDLIGRIDDRLDPLQLYLNLRNKIAKEKGYETVSGFSEGLARAKRNSGLSGKGRTAEIRYVDVNGNDVFHRGFRPDSENFHDGLAVVEEADEIWSGSGGPSRKTIIKRDGKNLLPDEVEFKERFDNGIILARDIKTQKFYYYNKDGTRKNEGTFDEAGPYVDGIARVRVGKKFYFIDESGNEAFEKKFDGAHDFSEERASVGVSVGFSGWQDRFECYFVNKKGDQVPTGKRHKYDETGDFREGVAPVRMGKTWFYINKIGKRAIRGDFLKAGNFESGIAIVIPRGEKGVLQKSYFLRKDGTLFPEGGFYSCKEWSEGVCTIQVETFPKNKYRLLKIDGDFLNTEEYLVAGVCHDGLISVLENKGMYFVDAKNGLNKFGRKWRMISGDGFSDGVAMVYDDVLGDLDATHYIDVKGRKIFG